VSYTVDGDSVVAIKTGKDRVRIIGSDGKNYSVDSGWLANWMAKDIVETIKRDINVPYIEHMLKELKDDRLSVIETILRDQIKDLAKSRICTTLKESSERIGALYHRIGLTVYYAIVDVALAELIQEGKIEKTRNGWIKIKALKDQENVMSGLKQILEEKQKGVKNGES